MKEETLAKPKKPRAEAAEDLEVVVPALRCPYCHDACAPSDSVVCRDCLARHHAECWSEQGACSACQSTVRLVAEERPVLGREEIVDLLRRGRAAEVEERFIEAGLSSEEAVRELATVACEELAALGPRQASALARALFGLQALFLGGLSVYVTDHAAEEPVWTAAAVLMITLMLMGGARLAGKLGRGSHLLKQTGLAFLGILTAMALIGGLDIAPSQSSLALAGLGLLIAGLSAIFAVRDPR